jgi:hypothetical protein
MHMKIKGTKMTTGMAKRNMKIEAEVGTFGLFFQNPQ